MRRVVGFVNNGNSAVPSSVFNPMKQPRAPLALFCFALAAPALAQETQPSPTPSEPPRREETVNVEAELPAVPPSATAATRLPVPVMELPASVSVVPRSLMSAQDVFTLTDALRNASGLNTASFNGVFDFFTVRGVDSLSGGLVLTDGVPEPESTFYPLYNVRQVEVLKGPGSFLYGGNPLAGAVQIVRKQPALTRFAEASFSYGRFGTYECAVDGNAGSSDGKVGFRFNAVRQGSDNFREIGEGVLMAVNPVLVWKPDDDTRVLASFEYLSSEQQPDSGIPYVGESGDTLADVPRERSYQSPFDFSEQDVYRVRLEAERKLSSSVTLRDRAYYTQLGWLSDGTLLSGAFPFPPAGRLTVIRTLVQLDDQQELLGNQLELAASFSTGSVRHELLAGFEVSQLKDRFDQGVALISPVDLENPVEVPGEQPIPLPQFGQQGDARALTFAPYLVDRVAFSSQWQAFVGARLDTLDYEDPLVDTERNDTQLSPLLGLVFSPSSRLAFHVSAGTSFAPPSTQVVGPRDPETSRQIEGGLKLQLLNGKAFIGATGYALEREDIAIPDSTGVFRQIGDQSVRGFELDFSSEPSKGFIAYASYAFTDAELTSFSEAVATPQGLFVMDRSGNTPAFVPRHIANLWLSKELGHGFNLAGGVRTVSEQFVGEDNRYTIDSYATLDAAVSYSNKYGRFSLHARNLTGTEYSTRGFGGVSAIPARPFELLARVDLRIGTR
jgi:catecholate siderophore receptor